MLWSELISVALELVPRLVEPRGLQPDGSCGDSGADDFMYPTPELMASKHAVSSKKAHSKLISGIQFSPEFSRSGWPDAVPSCVRLSHDFVSAHEHCLSCARFSASRSRPI